MGARAIPFVVVGVFTRQCRKTVVDGRNHCGGLAGVWWYSCGGGRGGGFRGDEDLVCEYHGYPSSIQLGGGGGGGGDGRGGGRGGRDGLGWCVADGT